MGALLKRLLLAAALVLGVLWLWPRGASSSVADAVQITAKRAPQFVQATKPEAALLPVKDRYAQLATLSEERVPADPAAPRFARYRMVRDESFKYPLLRVAEEWLRDAKGERLVKQTAMVGDHLMVSLKADGAGEALLQKLAALKPSVRKKMPASKLWIIAFADADVQTLPAALSLIQAEAQDLVTAAEFDYIAHALGLPNDARFSEMWGMHNTAQSGGLADADVDAPAAWDTVTGSRSVKIGCIDSGIDLTHPDLVANLWTNPQEIAGNGIDDDLNGYVDDMHGWDFYNDDSSPQDDNGHGTHTAGSVGAVGNNGVGVTGVCWQVSLIGLKFLNAGGSGVTSDAIEAVSYATARGVLATNNSWGGDGYSAALKAAIDAAGAAGSLFIAASGNEWQDLHVKPTYPACYTSDNVITVGAVTRQGAMAWFSNYGTDYVHLAAPGMEVLSTIPGGGYELNHGTSMACPHVAGAAALLKAYRPNLRAAEIKAHLLATTKPRPSLVGKVSSGGMLDLDAAVAAANDLAFTPVAEFVSSGQRTGPFTPTTHDFTLSNRSTSSLSWTATTNQPWLSLTASSGTLAAGQAQQLKATIDVAAQSLPVGDHVALVTVTHASTGRAQVRRVKLTVTRPLVADFPLSTDPGWTKQGEWEYGRPLGSGGIFFGFPDPTSGATGLNALGVRLRGDYTYGGGMYYVTSEAIDLSQHDSTVVSFKRWLNIDFQPWGYATVEVSNDGVTWWLVWDNGVEEIADNGWSTHSYDIGIIADGSSTAYVRWGYGLNNGAYLYSGWNLDDIQIHAQPRQRLNLTLAAQQLMEGSSTLATLTLNPSSSSAKTVSLTMSSAQATAPSTVEIPAGQTSVSFSVTAADDALVDGQQAVSLTATLAGYGDGKASLLVTDNELSSLALTLPSSMMEGAVGQVGTVTVAQPADSTLSVELSSSDITEVTLPAVVSIPSGASSVSFPITLPDDTELDDSQSVTLTATVQGWASGTASTTVTDNESSALVVSLPQGIAETAGTLSQAGTVSAAGTRLTDWVVSLSSADTGRLTLPSSVTIPAGYTSVGFDVTAIADAAATGHAEVLVTASSAGLTSGSASITVFDQQTLTTPVQPTPGHLATMVSPDADLAWLAPSGHGLAPVSYDVYFGSSASLGAAELVASGITQRSHALPRLMRGASYFWKVVAKAGSQEQSSVVWQFTVAPLGDVVSFAWSSIPSPQLIHQPFTATLTAKDAYGDTVTSFTGQANLATFTGDPEMAITELSVSANDGLELTNVSYRPVDLQSWQIVIYDDLSWPLPKATFVVPAGSVLAPGACLTLMENGTAPGSFPDFRLGSDFYWTEIGRVAVMLRKPDGSIVDFVCVRTGTERFLEPVPVPEDQWNSGPVDPSFNAAFHYHRTGSRDSNGSGDWVGAVPNMGTPSVGLALPFATAGPELPLASYATGAFTAGSWTGSITVQQTHPALRLIAWTEPSPGAFRYGISNSFAVQTMGALALGSSAARAVEDAGTLPAFTTITLANAPVNPMTITVTSSDASEVSSSSIAVAAGATAVAYDLPLADDSIVDGPQPVTLTFSAPGYEPTTRSLVVDDNEDGVLMLGMQLGAAEGDGSSMATVGLASVNTVPITVQLSSSDTSEITVPSSVTIPAGAGEVSFPLTVVEDDLIDGSQSSSITASVANWRSISQTFHVADNETLALSVITVPSITEGSAARSDAVRVQLSGRTLTDVEVTLRSAGSPELSLASTSATILANSSSVLVAATATDDTATDGSISVTISATAAGFTTGNSSLLVKDNDVHHFTASSIGTLQRNGSPIPWTVTAHDVNGLPLDAVAGPVDLAVTPALSLSPTGAVGFVNGVWSGTPRVQGIASGVKLSITAPTGATLESNAFDLLPGAILEVTAAAPIYAWAAAGDPLSFDSSSITLRNVGEGPLDWAAEPSQPGIIVTPATGTLGGTGSATTLTLSGVAPASGTASVTLRNVTNEQGTASRSIQLTLNQPAPSMLAEPAFTGGSTNSIAWSSDPLAAQYQSSVSMNQAAFVTGAWQTSLNRVVSQTHNVLYGYRVRSKHLAPDGRTVWESLWSPQTATRSDQQPPVIRMDLYNPYFTGSSSFTLTGETVDALAGTGSMSLSAGSMSTTNNYQSWQAVFSGLGFQEYNYVLSASDQAVPPNFASSSWTLRRVPEEQRTMLSFAFNVAPSRLIESVTTAIVTDAGKRYLQLSYPQRITPAGFQYHTESSGDLVNWEPSEVLGMSSVNLPDGLSKQTTWRLLPALAEGQQKFIRVRVTLDE
jgi:subtilisin family serine protease